jgi:hypothetical protein
MACRRDILAFFIVNSSIPDVTQADKTLRLADRRLKRLHKLIAEIMVSLRPLAPFRPMRHTRAPSAGCK